MKKVFVCILAAALVLSLFAGCAKTGEKDAETATQAAASDVASFQTIGDVLALGEDAHVMSATYKDVYVCVFEHNGSVWRLFADLNEEQSNALSELDILAEDYHEKESELLTPLAVTKCENLDDQKLSEEEMKALAGKTGEELINDGWTEGNYYNLDEMEFNLEKAPFMYTVVFEAQEGLENTDDFDVLEAIKTLKVKSVGYYGIGNQATDLPEAAED
ncbi:MAG: hypothetical protein IJJ85_03950 [Clostridia bacterium]|nr:hypothetical protein [Clostridia bacterium]